MDLTRIKEIMCFEEARQFRSQISRYMEENKDSVFPFGLYISPDGKKGVVVFAEDDAPDGWDLCLCNTLFLSPEGEDLKVQLKHFWENKDMK